MGRPYNTVKHSSQFSSLRTRYKDKEVKTILIANRGEIALRIQRACRLLGFRVVQVYSEADKDSLPVKLADVSVCIGKAAASSSYLNPLAILGAAKLTDAQAIHPGYGFLSERSDFVDLVEAEGLTFIGPTAEHIRLMGEKSKAREMAQKANVPTVPGSPSILKSSEEAKAIAADIGYPVLLKASAGGGGRGMRVVKEPSDLQSAFSEASSEAKLAFGDGALYLEKYLSDPQHIEVQVLCDGQLSVSVGERDCSTQRRRQKVIEEGPSPILDTQMREDLLESARRLCSVIGYRNAGTIEYVVKDGHFYFMEMNTRIQVEHPVTEAISGIDLVARQMEIAFRGPGSLNDLPTNVSSRGHAIECRINAEDPYNNFMPSPGQIQSLSLPGGPWVRVDSHIFSGYVIPPFYDSMVAKLICWAETRNLAIQRSLAALDEINVDGIKTNTQFLKNVLRSETFRSGAMHTQYVERELESLL
jgi:acetyl-CoA carboxylase biotin carboxylase subunit